MPLPLNWGETDMHIEMVVITTEDLGSKPIAHEFLNRLETLELRPDRIGQVEPLRQKYSFERAVNMWSEESDGCWEEGKGAVGKAGGMMGKSKLMEFMVMWWKCPGKIKMNYLFLTFPIHAYEKIKDRVLLLFKDTVLLTGALYGYISHSIPLSRQESPGTLNHRMPGVFWCNYFGTLYVDFFGKEKILSFPWENVEFLPSGGLVTFLAKEPHKELVQSDEREKKAKEHLGSDSFGDPSEYQTTFTPPFTPEDIENMFRIIPKKVPKIEK